MRLFVDTARLDEIEEWSRHRWVSGFTTNPTLMRAAGTGEAMAWAAEAAETAAGKPISIDGPPEVWSLGPNVWRKLACTHPEPRETDALRVNYTAVCTVDAVRGIGWVDSRDIVSVFAGRIMDTGRDPMPVIDAAKVTGASVLWASVREPYNIVQAEAAGCDIVTVPPAILRKYLDWNGKPLEVVAQETIAQFESDSEGLW